MNEMMDLSRCCICRRLWTVGSRPRWLVDTTTFLVLGKAHAGCHTRGTEPQGVEHPITASFLTWLQAQLSQSEWRITNLAFDSGPDLEWTAAMETALRWWVNGPMALRPSQAGPIRDRYEEVRSQFLIGVWDPVT